MKIMETYSEKENKRWSDTQRANHIAETHYYRLTGDRKALIDILLNSSVPLSGGELMARSGIKAEDVEIALRDQSLKFLVREGVEGYSVREIFKECLLRAIKGQ